MLTSMRTTLTRTATILLSLAFVLASRPDATAPTLSSANAHPMFSSLSDAEWSASVNLGPVINSAGPDVNAALSPDELSLYFTSDRAGGLGGNDIYVARRVCADCAWGATLWMSKRSPGKN